MMNMQTYNAVSFKQWMGWYSQMINPRVPRSAAGIGLGVWVDPTINGTWSVSAASASARVVQAMWDGVCELAMYRLDPQTGQYPPQWPEPFWWPALAPFMLNPCVEP
jgi:hypothetical protein